MDLYDNMAIVLSQTRKLSIVELGGKDGLEIITSYELGAATTIAYVIDPNVFSFVVTYLKKSKQFTWKHFAQNKYIHDAQPTCVQQICNGYLIRIN